MSKTRTPAIEGWFTDDAEAPALLGSRCTKCKAVFFPKETFACRNPACTSTELEEHALSRRGKLWSFTNNCYPPPLPYVAPEPFEPYAVAAVELEAEKMIVLGQVPTDVKVEDLSAGMDMELVIDTLSEDEDKQYTIWKWRPAA